MPPSIDEDEFGDGDFDEADLLDLVPAKGPGQEGSIDTDGFDDNDLHALEGPAQGTKRKASSDGNTSPKRLQTSFPCAVAALTGKFGFKSFQLKQEQVISRILSGQSATVVFPTGGGKSLCYQIPALVFPEVDELTGLRGGRNSGLSLVVSPLISLMKDQCDALRRRGIEAATLDSSKTREEYLHTCDMLREGKLRILYCAPERLNNEGFVGQMKTVRGGIRLLAVDEAHCISEWGHAFRPDYLKIARFVSEIKAERVICLTATATPRVAKDICDAFDIPETGLFRTTTYRPNLRLLAESGSTKKELYPRLFKFLRNNKGATIVYVTIQKQTDELAAELRRQGFNAKAFHAGMDTPVKTAVQEEFMAKNDLIIVATIAFGMGIDKASIRNVVHFNIPSSLESYSQEIGRAGRDGKTSNCIFYVCGEDLHLREMFARGDLPSRESIRGLMNDIFDSINLKVPVGGSFKTNHYEQEREFDIRSIALKNIYAQLEMTHGLIRATTPVYTKHSFKAGPRYQSISDKSLAAQAIKKRSKAAKTWHHLDVDIATTMSGISRSEIIRKLNDWNESRVLELKLGGVLNVYKITKALPQTSAEIDALVESLYCSMEKREQEALDRTDAMLRLITSERCFSRSLAQHFGDDLPGGKQECGHCTWCMTHAAVKQESPPQVPFNKSAFLNILDKVPDRDCPRLLARIAFGITSPRVTLLKLLKDPVFGSMNDHRFMDLLDAFTIECIKTQ